MHDYYAYSCTGRKVTRNFVVMKQPLKQQMHKDLRDAYKAITDGSCINPKYANRWMVIKILQERQAPRFYITANKAEHYVLGYYHGDPKVLRHKNQDMIRDLVANYERLKKKHPHTPQELIWEMVVESPAQRFYLVPSVMEAIIFRHWKYRQ